MFGTKFPKMVQKNFHYGKTYTSLILAITKNPTNINKLKNLINLGKNPGKNFKNSQKNLD